MRRLGRDAFSETCIERDGIDLDAGLFREGRQQRVDQSRFAGRIEIDLGGPGTSPNTKQAGKNNQHHT